MLFKNKRIWLACFIAAGMVTVFAGCSEDDPTKPEAETAPTPLNTPAGSATILPSDEQSTVLAYDSGTGAMTLDETSKYAQDVKVGTVLVGQDAAAAPDGFLRKVTGVTNDGGHIILETAPALLTEAFVQMAIADTLQLHPSQIKTSKFYNGTTLVPDKADETFSVEIDCVLYDHDNDHETTDDQIKLVGQYEFTAALFARIDISGSTLNKLEIGIETDQKVHLEVLAGFEWEFENEQEFALWEVRLGAIPFGGFVWIVPTLNVEAHVHGDLSVTFETTVNYTQKIRNGCGYDRDASPQFDPISGSEKNFSFTPTTFTTEFDFEVGASLNTSCILYGVDGPSMEGKTGIHFEAVLSDDPCVVDLMIDLEAIFYAVVGLEMDAYVFDLDWNKQFELYTHPVGDWVFSLDESGTVVINPEPDLINARWTLDGPCSYSENGSGDQTLLELSPGEYTLTWDAESGFFTPPVDTQSLMAYETVTFSGTYNEGEYTGTIQIDLTPDLGVDWSLAGPNNMEVTGSGDDILADMLVGDYTLTWDIADGYPTPSVDTQTLAADETVTFSGTYLVDFVPIPAGTFTMGSPQDELGRYDNEAQHTVQLTTPFLMSTIEVTNRQFAALAQWAYDEGYCTATRTSLRDNLDGSTQELLDLSDSDCEISFRNGTFTVDVDPQDQSFTEDQPVKEVTWYGSVAYCDWLSLQAGLSRAYDHSTWECNSNDPYGAEGYRLPTEAEWEYACRAGSGTAFANGEIADPGCNDPVLVEIGWYCGNQTDQSHTVGQLMANGFGLYDMHGNLFEWCNDWSGSYSGDETDPVGGSPGDLRMLRGSCWFSYARGCRSAYRGSLAPDFSEYNIGFRPVRSTN